MLIGEYMQMRNITPQVTTGNPTAYKDKAQENAKADGNNPFARELTRQISERIGRKEVSTEELESVSDVRFSKHAVDRINERGIDMYSNSRIDRLNKAVELAGEKNADDAVVFIDQTAFLVSVKNNRVITAVTADDIQGNIFTNIDSAVIM